MNPLRTHRLPPTEFYPEVYQKKQIYLHHTVSGSFDSVWNHWTTDKAKDGSNLRVGTAFVVDVNGDVYEVFDPKYWAHHLGMKTPANSLANKQSIGIELVSEGALIEVDGKLRWLDGEASYESKRMNPVDLGYEWRGYRWFDQYEDAQVDAVCELVTDLCLKFKIPMMLIPGDKNRYGEELISFNGVLTHCNVRADKSDVHPMFPWEKLQRRLDEHCQLEANSSSHPFVST